MSRLSSSLPTGVSSSSSTVVVKKVTFSQPTSRGRQQAVVGNVDRMSSTGNKKRRRHLVESKKMEDSSSKPLLPAAGMMSDASLSSTVTTATTTVGTEPCSNPTESNDDETTPPRTCPDYFGVKSYLHHFYETVSVKNPDLYEELKGGDVNRPRKQPSCRSIWWKVAVGCGVNLLVIGIVIILVGYLVPRQQIFVAHRNELEVVDRAAVRYNYNLDACKLIGLIVFCVGGITVAIALLFPSFLYNYCDEDWNQGPDEVAHSLSAPDDENNEEGEEDKDAARPPGSPTEKNPVPATEQVTKVQPTWDQESLRPPIR